MCCSHRNRADQASELFDKRNWNKNKKQACLLPLHLPFSYSVFLYYLPHPKRESPLCSLLLRFQFCQLPFMDIPSLQDGMPICSPSCLFCCFLLQPVVTWMPPVCHYTHLCLFGGHIAHILSAKCLHVMPD